MVGIRWLVQKREWAAFLMEIHGRPKLSSPSYVLGPGAFWGLCTWSSSPCSCLSVSDGRRRSTSEWLYYTPSISYWGNPSKPQHIFGKLGIRLIFRIQTVSLKVLDLKFKVLDDPTGDINSRRILISKREKEKKEKSGFIQCIFLPNTTAQYKQHIPENALKSPGVATNNNHRLQASIHQSSILPPTTVITQGPNWQY
jgi:hypothetical protein